MTRLTADLDPRREKKFRRLVKRFGGTKKSTLEQIIDLAHLLCEAVDNGAQVELTRTEKPSKIVVI